MLVFELLYIIPVIEMRSTLNDLHPKVQVDVTF